MITINTAPLANRILLDANNTVISITSSNGSGFYFRAEIYVDDALFDTQGWSRKNNFTAEKNLKNLYKSYFETVFNADFFTGIFEVNHLKKKIQIVIKEYNLQTDAFVQEQSLPVFFILYNAKSVFFDDTLKVQLLGVDATILQLSESGKISLPIMVNASNENYTVKLKNNQGMLLHQVSTGVIDGKKIFIYNFDLSLILLSNTTFVAIEISNGLDTLVKNCRILSLPDYPVKELAFENNFGYWIYTYLDGLLSIESSLGIEKYERNDGTEKAFEINEEFTYSINSGTLVFSEKEILRQIVNSLSSKIKSNGQWIDLVPETKKINILKEKNHGYSENLTFKVRQNTSEDNLAMSLLTPTITLIYVIKYINLPKVRVYFNSNVAGPTLKLKVTGDINQTFIINNASPEIVVFSVWGNYQYQLTSMDDSIVSNIFIP